MLYRKYVETSRVAEITKSNQFQIRRNSYTQRMRYSDNEQQLLIRRVVFVVVVYQTCKKMSTDYHTAQGDFTSIVYRLQPMVLSNFVMWLDLKVAEFKVYGQMLLGKLKWRLNRGTLLLLLTYFRLVGSIF